VSSSLSDPGFIAGASAMLGSVFCLLALRKRGAAFERTQAELRAMLRAHKAECSERIEQLGCGVAILELTAQNIDEAGKAGLTRSVRSQAMQLLRCGTSPDSAASTLGIGRREMRLLARVSRILSPR
jgi:hypothetical protein